MMSSTGVSGFTTLPGVQAVYVYVIICKSVLSRPILVAFGGIGFVQASDCCYCWWH